MLNEKQIADIQYEMEGKGFTYEYRYNRIDQFDEWYHGDNVWIAFVVGYILSYKVLLSSCKMLKKYLL